MKVIIKNKSYNFLPGFNSHKPSDNGWKKQNQDNFKFCAIGGINVFIKRFEKEVKHISGYKFLQKVKNKKLPFLPTTYDLVTVRENGKSVTYIFQEVLKGKTLEEVIEDGVFNFNPQLFIDNIYSALETITNEGFWYADFVEKNIFVGNDGSCYLIDLDSVVPISVLPNNDISQVNRNYQIAIFTYWYRDVLKYNFTDIGNNLRGDTLNFLQLFVFIAQVKYFIENDCKPNFLSSNTRKSIPRFLLSKNKAYTIAIFKSCFEPSKKHQQTLNIELFNSYVKSVLFTNNKTIKINFSKKKIVNGNNQQKRKPPKKSNPELLKVKKMVDNYQVFGVLKIIESLRSKYPNDNEIKNLKSDVEKKINKCEDYYLQANQCFYSHNFKAALRYVNYIRGIADDFEEANFLKKMLKDREESYRSHLILLKEPYECPNCKFPIENEVMSAFTNTLFWGLPISFAIIGFNLFSWIGVFSLLIGLIIWAVVINILPSKWIYKEQTCYYCGSSYNKVSSELKKL